MTNHGLSLLVSWLRFILKGVLVRIWSILAAAWTPPEYWDADDIALEVPEHPNIWTDGSREDFSSVGVLKLLMLALPSCC